MIDSHPLRPVDLVARRLPVAALAVGLWAGLGIAGIARADIISDKEAQCRGAAKGDACTLDGKAGVCASATCSRNDYSDGPPPKTVQSDCMVCTVGGEGKAAPEPTAANVDAPAPHAADAQPAEPTPAKADEPAAVPSADTANPADAKTPAANAEAPAPTKADTKADTKPAAPEQKSGCSSGAPEAGPWLLGSLLLGLGLLRLGRARR